MINLFINYFDHPDKERREEIEYCLEKNQSNEHIDKIIIVNRDKRATYGEFMEAMKDYTNDVNIIANTDIYFDDTVILAEKIRPRMCYALTRWEHIGGNVISWNSRHGKPSPAQWSQDAWIFRGAPNAEGFNEVRAINGNKMREIIPFGLGIPGCDNKFAALLRRKGFTVTNPSLSIKAIHKHRSESRSYPKYQILEGIKPYGLVYQTKL